MNKQIIVVALALPLALSSAFAQELTAPTVKISGFGTGALTFSNTDQAEFGRANQASGAKRNSPSTGVDSNLGLQADIGVNSWLSFTGQGLVRRDAEDDFGAELSLGFAKVRVNDHFSFRIGRTAMPTFMISDFRNVGYANNFLRAPVEMYSQVPYSALDGIDATYQQSFGDTTITGNVGFGRSQAKIVGGVTAEANHTTSVNLTAEHGPFTARFSRVDAKITITGSSNLSNLLNNLRAAGTGYRMPQLNTLADQLTPIDKDGSFTSVGLTMDWNNIVAQSEFAKRKNNSYVTSTTSWYVMGGYRFGKVLPYFIQSKLKIDDFPTNVVPAACPAGYPAACTPTMATLRGYVAGLPYYGTGQGEQSTTSLGMRWDFHNSMALKAQIDRVKPAVGNGLLINAAPGFQRDITVGAVALDFVF
ncbi:hypothetical protein G4G28_05500 [Massilia sp. Dwa41.01b]|uniref:hypothetical protein n=1 Tax=unclassified Massilia TaxID=2609279 RepID=UPI0016042B94|nr:MULTISPECIES: hypothetical protein [unclassified Massilia]QNA88079.1 hypothetical protein G4G28_05500 [Massilia sp. Dwa41.01b]QNA98986.1 hypothetical protein G4G31_09220 [Massilia sp. Se16.2.3]